MARNSRHIRREEIERGAEHVSATHRAMKDAARERDKSEKHRERHARALDAFRSSFFPIHYELWRACRDPNMAQIDRDLAFDYLDADPFYFGSGYLKEMLIQRLKKTPFTRAEAELLRELILSKVARGRGVFTNLCRLIPRLETPEFVAQLQDFTDAATPEIRRRARFALHYVPGGERYNEPPELN